MWREAISSKLISPKVAQQRRTHSANGGAALSEEREARNDVLDSRDGVGELLNVARELLAEGERRRVLEVGAADLDDVLKLGALDFHRVAELVQSREERGVELRDGGDVHGCREAVEREDRYSSAHASRPCTRLTQAGTHVSLDDWLMLQWSLGWTGFLEPSSPPSVSMALLEMTCSSEARLVRSAGRASESISAEP